MTADLIVVDKLARLYDCPEDEMLCYVLAVIGRGASVVTLSTWNLAARNPNKVALDERDSASAIGDTRISRRAMQTIDTAEEARKTTPKHEFVCLHDVGRLREWLVTSRDWNEKITIFIVILTYFFIVLYIR